jgi:hypothetical protein
LNDDDENENDDDDDDDDDEYDDDNDDEYDEEGYRMHAIKMSNRFVGDLAPLYLRLGSYPARRNKNQCLIFLYPIYS